MTRAPSALVLLLAAACSAPDYTPARDWARTASLVVAYPAPAATSEDRRDGIAAMQQALAMYLAALSLMADDGIPAYREDPFAELAPRAARADPAGGAAVASLGAMLRRATLENWQAPDLRNTIAVADPALQALVTALAGSLRAAAPAPEPPAPRAAPPVTDPAAARADYIAVVTRIGTGHALLVASAPRLTDPEVMQRIRAAEDDLRRAGFALPRPVVLVAPS
ncbi:hypothetical protein [Roseomonas fluvialis]|uniref:Lipoprotein n=1 Tax=Roseomonas fluvialis TaxID=1750527 RepID=A0ABM7Y4P0_9PROT|nr:hypothetical protein [Roseomonas fluvialis]BDG72846.1 hypothetical protein Rmf_27750 [Roseomonas fluvialis]